MKTYLAYISHKVDGSFFKPSSYFSTYSLVKAENEQEAKKKVEFEHIGVKELVVYIKKTIE